MAVRRLQAKQYTNRLGQLKLHQCQESSQRHREKQKQVKRQTQQPGAGDIVMVVDGETLCGRR